MKDYRIHKQVILLKSYLNSLFLNFKCVYIFKTFLITIWKLLNENFIVTNKTCNKESSYYKIIVMLD
ncbi:unnamed protein product [Blepharisma stoltei]|uniref:Uncharacterized protein n=1 Tax=Blepharisma stoltei TaxID=1481888 RepID=A0AAU9JWL2_9CILI|nr:unnamed protein product [Blepharisma stoltei]